MHKYNRAKRETDLLRALEGALMRAQLQYDRNLPNNTSKEGPMPWNDNKGSGGGGPWGGGGSGGGGGGNGDSPWGRPGGPGGQKPPGAPGGAKDRPDLEDTLRRMQERFKRKGGGGNGSGPGGGAGRGRRGLRCRPDRCHCRHRPCA